MHVIVHDRFDDDDWAAALELGDVARCAQTLASIDHRAPVVFADAFHGMLRARPRLVGVDDVPIEWQVNHRVMATMMDHPLWEEVRAFTVGRVDLAIGALTAMASELARLYRSAWRLLDTSDADDGDELDALLAGFQPAIDGCVTDALAAGHDEAGSTDRAFAGWGYGAGEISSTSPAARLELAATLDTPRMATIASYMGRLNAQAAAANDRQLDQGPGAVTGVTLGRNLNRLVSTELLGLAMPALYPDFIDRYDRGQLLVHETHLPVPQRRGPIIYVEDSSTTMLRDNRGLWARALGLCLARIAHRQGRGFRAIVFSAAGNITAFDLPASAPTEHLLEYATFHTDGGTDFQAPLAVALGYLTAEHDATGATQSDLVFATDGDADLDTDWLAWYRQVKQTLGFTTYGVAIGPDTAKSIDLVSDRVTSIKRITDTTDVTDVFTLIQQETP